MNPLMFLIGKSKKVRAIKRLITIIIIAVIIIMIIIGGIFILDILDLYDLGGVGSNASNYNGGGDNRLAEEVINAAVSWANKIAADESHGYNNTEGKRWGPDYACSSFIIQAWEEAGIPVKSSGATKTANMKDHFLKNGFTEVTSEINLQTGEGMKKGDIFINPGVHTEMAINEKQFVGARGTPNSGKPENGKEGDQGGEISISNFFANNWKIVLRYNGEI